MSAAPDKVRLGIIRKQNFIYLAMVAIGLYLMAASQMVDPLLMSEGTAFIIVGFVGMLMSFTTMDIGASIKEAIREVGRQNAEFNRRFDETQKEIAESQKEIAESQKEIIKLQGIMATLLENSNKSQKDIKESQKDIKESQKDIKESQKDIKELLDGGKR